MDILWNKIKDMLEIAGYNVAKIKQDLLYESDSDMIITSIPGISILLLLLFLLVLHRLEEINGVIDIMLKRIIISGRKLCR